MQRTLTRVARVLIYSTKIYFFYIGLSWWIARSVRAGMVPLLSVYLVLGTQELSCIESLPRKTTFLSAYPCPSPPSTTLYLCWESLCSCQSFLEDKTCVTPLLPPLSAFRVLKTRKKLIFH